MQFTTQDIERMRSCDVYGGEGQKLGKAGQVWLDDASGRPEWITVATGLFGSKESFVPLRTAEWKDDTLRVPFTRDQVKGAAKIEPEADHLSEEAEQELYRYYGLTSGGSQFGQGEQLGEGTGSAYSDDTGYSDIAYSGTGFPEPEYREGSGDRIRAEDTLRRSSDDAMTRSEEHLSVGTESMPTGRARLRKYVVTEEQQVTVPVQHEEVRLEREPITDANRDEAFSGQEISEAEHEVTLSTERPVVTTEAVPVERVRLDKETVTEQETVSGVVRQERVELEEEGDAEESVEDVTLTRDRQRQP